MEHNLAAFGPSARLHGHNYLVEVTAGGEVDPQTGMVMSLSDLKRALHNLLEAFDHKNLNEDCPHVAGLNPTTEHLASMFWQLLAPCVTGLARIRLYESPDVFVDYGEGPARSPTTGMPFAQSHVYRVYRFSAAHRLWSPRFTEEENLRVYGKCSSRYGHGHDYTLEVTLAAPSRPPERDPGPPEPKSPDIDRLVREQVLAAFDHCDLNHDVEEFRRLIPTAEHILIVAWERLVKRLPPGCLAGLRLVETRDNYFEYHG